jgi:hypothetical protein
VKEAKPSAATASTTTAMAKSTKVSTALAPVGKFVRVSPDRPGNAEWARAPTVYKFAPARESACGGLVNTATDPKTSSVTAWIMTATAASTTVTVVSRS